MSKNNNLNFAQEKNTHFQKMKKINLLCLAFVLAFALVLGFCSFTQAQKINLKVYDIVKTWREEVPLGKQRNSRQQRNRQASSSGSTTTTTTSSPVTTPTTTSAPSVPVVVNKKCAQLLGPSSIMGENQTFTGSDKQTKCMF